MTTTFHLSHSRSRNGIEHFERREKLSKQWRSQDTEVARAQELQAAEGSALRRVASIIPREARKKSISHSFFSYQDGLS